MMWIIYGRLDGVSRTKTKKLSASESLFLQKAASPPATPAASPASSSRGKKNISNAVRDADVNAASQAKARWDILDIYIYIYNCRYIYIYITNCM